jgi:pimeloyl-ACP methyl ester carboxylesterase
MTLREIDSQAFRETFEHRVSGPYGHRLHYVIGGSGEPLLLVPGWPQTWYAFRRIMPRLAERYTVVAVDPPGLGDSDKPFGGYDTGSVARRLKELTDDLGWDGCHFVGHDIGCWIGYPFAAMFPEMVRKLVLMDATVPGIVSPDAYAFEPERIVRNWHFFFNAIPDLPEALVIGRERAFLSWLFAAKSANPAAIDGPAIDEYVRCYSKPGAWRAGLAYYRALFEGAKQNRLHAMARIKTPVLTIGGESGLGELMEQMMQAVAKHVSGRIITGCGHYVAEEAPEQLTEMLFDFLN